jgi:pyruvate kinase
VYAVTDNPVVARRLALVWGVVPVVADLVGDVSEAAARIGDMLVQRGSIPLSSNVVLVSITPDLARGPSNFVKVQRV